MEIYVLRHGIAEAVKPGRSDSDRALTEEGRVKLQRVLERARTAKAVPSLILSSPYLRAVQTAELAAEFLSYKGRIVRTDALLPGSAPEDVWDEIRRRPNENAVLLAGHEPLLSSVVSYFLGASSVLVNMKKGALARIDFDRPGAEPRGVLQWLLTPKLAE